MIVPDETLRAVLEPPHRGWRSAGGLRDAAVVAPWFTRDGRDGLLYTLRRADLRHHAGEVSFPGGGREGDEDALACALRELEEEVGITAAAIDLLGRLDERRSSAGFLVHAFVGRIEPPAALRLDPSEVEAVLEIPVDELRRKERWEFRDPRGGTRRRVVPFFEFDRRTLWGLTGRLTLDLLGRLGTGIDADG